MRSQLCSPQLALSTVWKCHKDRFRKTSCWNLKLLLNRDSPTHRECPAPHPFSDRFWGSVYNSFLLFLLLLLRAQELCKAEVAVLGFPSPIVFRVTMDVKHQWNGFLLFFFFFFFFARYPKSKSVLVFGRYELKRFQIQVFVILRLDREAMLQSFLQIPNVYATLATRFIGYNPPPPPPPHTHTHTHKPPLLRSLSVHVPSFVFWLAGSRGPHWMSSAKSFSSSGSFHVWRKTALTLQGSGGCFIVVTGVSSDLGPTSLVTGVKVSTSWHGRLTLRMLLVSCLRRV